MSKCIGSLGTSCPKCHCTRCISVLLQQSGERGREEQRPWRKGRAASAAAAAASGTGRALDNLGEVCGRLLVIISHFWIWVKLLIVMNTAVCKHAGPMV